MKSAYFSLKPKIIKLRKVGKTYGEIRKILGKNIPKSTLSLWCGEIPLLPEYQKRLRETALVNSGKGLKVALAVNKARREKYLKSIEESNAHLSLTIKNKDVAKISLAMLYLGEGSKDPKRGSLVFGNSDPLVVRLFLWLLRYCYKIDEKKLHCTLQGRADHNTKELEQFWSRVTQIPLSQFYKVQIDPRTIGKPSKKPDYKGVCRIDYFSADLLLNLLQIPKTIFGPIA